MVLPDIEDFKLRKFMLISQFCFNKGTFVFWLNEQWKVLNGLRFSEVANLYHLKSMMDMKWKFLCFFNEKDYFEIVCQLCQFN